MEEKKTAWERLKLVHTKGRPTIRDYIPLIFNDFYEMHGDRFYGDDKAVIGGIAMPLKYVGRLISKSAKRTFASRLQVNSYKHRLQAINPKSSKLRN